MVGKHLAVCEKISISALLRLPNVRYLKTPPLERAKQKVYLGGNLGTRYEIPIHLGQQR